MRLTGITFAYPDVDGAVRAELASKLQRGQAPEGVFVLSTCLRIEVLVTGDRTLLVRACEDLFGNPMAVDEGRMRHDLEALTHLFRVAAGLESPIVGEREILTQFRHTLSDQEARGSVGGLLAKLLEASVAAGRQVRNLLPDSPHGSMAAIAAQMVGASERVAVLGAGAMGRSVALNLLALPAPPEVMMVVRSPDDVDLPGTDVVPMAMARTALEQWPAVVSATSAKGRLIADSEVHQLLGRRSEPLVLVDMAMPPDINHPLTTLVRYVDIDELARRAQRSVDTAEADRFICDTAAEVFRHAGRHHEIGPLIGEMMRSADAIVERTVDRFAGRLVRDDDRSVLRQTAHTVARTLLAGPVSYLRSSDLSPEALDLFVDAFGVQND